MFFRNILLSFSFSFSYSLLLFSLLPASVFLFLPRAFLVYLSILCVPFMFFVSFFLFCFFTFFSPLIIILRQQWPLLPKLFNIKLERNLIFCCKFCFPLLFCCKLVFLNIRTDPKLGHAKGRHFLGLKLVFRQGKLSHFTIFLSIIFFD